MLKFMYVYILKCFDKTYYVGVTNNLDRRFQEHQEGINHQAYTHSRRPVELVWNQLFSNPDEAIQFEKKIKKWSRAKKKALISGEYDDLIELSKNKREREK